MKNKKTTKTFSLLTLIFSAYLLLTPITSYASHINNWEITQFTSIIDLHKDSSITVKEKITVDFSKEAHHGIKRDIPIVYEDEHHQNYTLRYKILSVKDNNGNNLKYSHYKWGDYVEIKIGDPDKLIQKQITYNITYTLNRVVIFDNENYDELYLNTTGDEWPVPIKNATTIINLPEKVQNLKTICFTGSYGSTEQNCKITKTDTQATYTITKPLGIREGLTIGLGLDKNILHKPSTIKEIIWFLEDNWGYLIPLLTLILLTINWYKHGKDPKISHTAIMPIYTPPNNITPSEAGTLIDETVDMRDIIATIIDMAVRGYIRIEERTKKKFWFKEKKYTLHLKKQNLNIQKSH